MAETDHGLFEDDRRKALWNMIEDGDVLQNGAEEEWAPSVQGQADALLEVAGIVLDKADARYSILCGYVRRAMLEEVRRSQSRLSGRSAGEEFDTLFATYGAGKNSSKAANRSRNDPALSDLVEQFLDDPSRKRGQHAVDDYRVVLRFLSEFVDPAATVSLVGREHCRKMVMLLRRMPANASKKKALRGLPPVKAADLAERLGIPPMSATTANSYISKMSALFRWAVREGLLDHNPAEGLLLPEETHRRDARLPFSTNQIRTILGSDVFRIPVATWDHRQWVFLLGLYGGLRLNEACGLTCDDVAEREGVLRWSQEIGQFGGEVKVCDDLDLPTIERLPEILGREDFRDELNQAFQAIIGVRISNEDIFIGALYALAKGDREALKQVRRNAGREWRESEQIARREVLSQLPESADDVLEELIPTSADNDS